jgi:hypothetical protein
MTEVLSTLNRLEQSRFEAFLRSTLPADVISDFVAHCLLLHNEHLTTRQESHHAVLLGAGSGMGSTHLEHVIRHNAKDRLNDKRPLSDLVAPGHARDIVVVVTTLAKAYAQRLTAAARRVATAMGVDVSEPLQPEHLQKAHYARVLAGMDPNFFLGVRKSTEGMTQVPCGKVAAAALGCVDRHDLLRQATLQAQQDYDEYLKTGKSRDYVKTLSPETSMNYMEASSHPSEFLAEKLVEEQTPKLIQNHPRPSSEEIPETVLVEGELDFPSQPDPSLAPEPMNIETNHDNDGKPAEESASAESKDNTEEQGPIAPIPVAVPPPKPKSRSLEEALLDDLDDDDSNND